MSYSGKSWTSFWLYYSISNNITMSCINYWMKKMCNTLKINVSILWIIWYIFGCWDDGTIYHRCLLESLNQSSSILSVNISMSYNKSMNNNVTFCGCEDAFAKSSTTACLGTVQLQYKPKIVTNNRSFFTKPGNVVMLETTFKTAIRNTLNCSPQ